MFQVREGISNNSAFPLLALPRAEASFKDECVVISGTMLHQFSDIIGLVFRLMTDVEVF